MRTLTPAELESLLNDPEALDAVVERLLPIVAPADSDDDCEQLERWDGLE